VCYPLRSVGVLTPLFCLPPAGGIGWVYAGITSSLHPERPVYCLQATGIADAQPFPESLDYNGVRLYFCHAGVFSPTALTISSVGLLAAFSHYAMACDLRRQQQDISMLAILDMYPLRVDMNHEQLEQELQEIEERSRVIEHRLVGYMELVNTHLNTKWGLVASVRLS